MLKDGEAGIIVLDDNQDKQYSNFKWPFKAKNPLVIHRLAVQPALQGEGVGVGKRLCLFAEDFALDYEYDSVRIRCL
ncbi:MAG: GNAT family N-acetyltransferase [Saprospiraceae bacterium]